MKLIEDIKKVEEKAENLKKDAEKKGRSMIEQEREKGEKQLILLSETRENLMEKKIAEAKKDADKETKKLEQEYNKILVEIKDKYKKKKAKSIKEVQNIILKWPLSQ
ncbi:MAG: hypothetical protein WBB67_15630 [bacterium]